MPVIPSRALHAARQSPVAASVKSGERGANLSSSFAIEEQEMRASCVYRLEDVMRTAIFAAFVATAAAMPAHATTVYPIDRADILAGAKFDFKVEFDGVADPAKVKVTINGKDYASVIGAGKLIDKEEGVNASALIVRDVVIDSPGAYKVEAGDGSNTKAVTWNVYKTATERKAKNVILFIGDGLSIAHRTAARILSKGIVEGKYKGPLEMDDMPHMALITTSGVDSIITDSANSASAYNTGHKSSVNALGVYADRTKDTLDDPKQETLAELLKRRMSMAIGVVSDAELEDATPAAVVAHTRRRADKAEIVGMFHDVQPQVMLGGGSAYFLPKGTPGSKRKDDQDYIARFKQSGYQLVTTAADMNATAAKSDTTRLLGLFHTGNMNGVLDRRFLKPKYVAKFPSQPDLTEMTDAAIKVLSRNPNGFFLMVEAALVDKYSHPLDWERAVYDTIMFDKAVAIAKHFADAAQGHAGHRHRRPHPRRLDRRHHRRQRQGRGDARQGRRLRQGRLPELRRHGRRRLSRHPRRLETPRLLLRRLPRLLRNLAAQDGRRVRPDNSRREAQRDRQPQVQGPAGRHAPDRQPSALRRLRRAHGRRPGRDRHGSGRGAHPRPARQHRDFPRNGGDARHQRRQAASQRQVIEAR